MPRRPYRCGGAAGPISIDPEAEARMIDSVALAPRLGLVGLGLVRFPARRWRAAAAGGQSASGCFLDVLDDASGSLFRAHVEACLGADSSAPLPRTGIRPERAPPLPLCGPWNTAASRRVDWPDPGPPIVPRPGSTMERGPPVATVIAEGDDLANVRRRPAANAWRLLEKLLYEGENRNGAPLMTSTYGPSPSVTARRWETCR